MKKAAAVYVFTLAIASSTAWAVDDTAEAVIGGAAGGAVGAAIGNELGDRNGAIAGAAIGAAVGTAIATGDDDSHHHSHRDSDGHGFESAASGAGHPHARHCPPGQRKKNRC